MNFINQQLTFSKTFSQLNNTNHRYGSSNQINMDNSFHHYGFNLTSKSLPKIKKYPFETVLNNSLPQFIDKQENDHKIIDSDFSLPYLSQSLIPDQKLTRYNYESPLISTRNSRRTLFDLNLNNSTPILNSNENIFKPKFPIKPSEALLHYYDQLSDFERIEIFNYSQIYFLGLESKKISCFNLKDYDDEHGYYKQILKDQICYRYEIFEILGKGSFGIVIRCYDHQLNEFIALKILKNNKRLEKQGLVEINILKYLKSLDQQNTFNIVHFKEYFYFRSHLCITFELLGINLYQLIKKNNYQGFSIHLIKRFANSILQSLQILFKENIIHCDIKPENILLKKKGSSQIKLIDFGSGCFQSEKIYTYIQSRFYRAPEVILGISYTTAIDMWSFGCILVELFTGHPIFPGQNEEEQLSMIMEVIDFPPINLLGQGTRTKLFFDSKGRPRKILKKRRPASRSLGEILRTTDNNFIDFICQCLQWDPLQRLTPCQALIHPWIIENRRNSKLTINEDSSFK